MTTAPRQETGRNGASPRDPGLSYHAILSDTIIAARTVTALVRDVFLGRWRPAHSSERCESSERDGKIERESLTSEGRCLVEGALKRR